MRLSKTQEKTLRNIYRGMIKNDFYGLPFVSEYNVHKSSAQSLIKRGLVRRECASDQVCPPGYAHGYSKQWIDIWVYTLTDNGIEVVKQISPILINDTVNFFGEKLRVISWMDDYSTIELDKPHGLFVPPAQVVKVLA